MSGLLQLPNLLLLTRRYTEEFEGTQVPAGLLQRFLADSWLVSEALHLPLAMVCSPHCSHC